MSVVDIDTRKTQEHVASHLVDFVFFYAIINSRWFQEGFLRFVSPILERSRVVGSDYGYRASQKYSICGRLGGLLSCPNGNSESSECPLKKVVI
jgi:hypothetical protein